MPIVPPSPVQRSRFKKERELIVIVRTMAGFHAHGGTATSAAGLDLAVFSGLLANTGAVMRPLFGASGAGAIQASVVADAVARICRFSIVSTLPTNG